MVKYVAYSPQSLGFALISFSS